MVKKIRKKKVMFYAKKDGIERTDYSDGSRSIIMPSELEEAFKEQRKLFIEKFGREPNPDDDPIFFDPDADTPQPYPEEKFSETLVEAMRKVGMDERYIRAYKKTGLLVTQDNMDLMTPEELEEFEEALESEESD